ncbi:MAG: hypothetical protein KF746_14110 [Chitinophagaceae bacterium]|nr:hypothetical protein [Chitinophagaceae bacterium]
MEQPCTYDIKTVLKVDQQFEVVRQIVSTILNEDNGVPANQNSKTKKNSFSFGWVSSFSITTIKVKLIKESDNSTAIFVEARQPAKSEGQKRIAYDGFYDFLQFLKKKFATSSVNHALPGSTEYLGAWAMIFIILLTFFLGWYYLFAD